MKKLPLKQLALMGITAGLVASQGIHASELNLNQQLVDQYICATYNNCGKCGGACNLKNPETPGLTDEQKKEAKEWKQSHKDEKGKPQDGCAQTFCGAQKENAGTDSNTSKMKAKRGFLR